MTSTTITTSLATYCPTLDLATITVREALDLFEVLSATSTLLNAALHQRPKPMVRYLDDWQALLNQARMEMADIIHQMRPTDHHQMAMRNFLLVQMRLDSAAGPVDLTGPGTPQEWAGSMVGLETVGAA